MQCASGLALKRLADARADSRSCGPSCPANTAHRSVPSAESLAETVRAGERLLGQADGAEP